MSLLKILNPEHLPDHWGLDAQRDGECVGKIHAFLNGVQVTAFAANRDQVLVPAYQDNKLILTDDDAICAVVVLGDIEIRAVLAQSSA